MCGRSQRTIRPWLDEAHRGCRVTAAIAASWPVVVSGPEFADKHRRAAGAHVDGARPHSPGRFPIWENGPE